MFTKCDTGEWNEKCNYASDILLKCPRGQFVLLLSDIDMKCCFKRNLAANLPLNLRLSGKFEMYNFYKVE